MWYSRIIIASKYHNCSPLYLLSDIAIFHDSIKGSYSASCSSPEMKKWICVHVATVCTYANYLQAATSGVAMHIPYIVYGTTGHKEGCFVPNASWLHMHKSVLHFV